MDDTLWCPFTDKPCMGSICACAVYDRYANPNHAWRCGMVPCAGNVLQQPIEREAIDD